MNEIEQYRKASAEWMGRKLDAKGAIIYESTVSVRIYWHPDIDANQMLMVLEWLRKQCYNIHIIINLDIIEIRLYDDENDPEHCYLNNGKDLFKVTMKAFMEYIKSE